MFRTYRMVMRSGVVLLALLLAACSASEDEALGVDEVAQPVVVTGHVQEAQAQFLNGNFGLAERSYRQAVEQHPRDAEAWLGLAASYDELHRFDLADKAYEQVRKLLGDTPAVLNNVGYSYLLRGDLDRAKSNIMAAYERDPDDPTIRRNVDRLNEELAKGAG